MWSVENPIDTAAKVRAAMRAAGWETVSYTHLGNGGGDPAGRADALGADKAVPRTGDAGQDRASGQPAAYMVLGKRLSLIHI